MSVANKVTLETAEPVAERLRELLAPACERILIAGSIRRRASLVGDIELIAIPKIEMNRPAGSLFESLPQPVNRLIELTNRIERGQCEGIRRATKAERAHMPAWGEKWRRMVAEYAPGRSIAVDLFMVTRASWGMQLTIRTGPGDFSKLLMTATTYGGAMLPGMKSREGQLCYRVDKRKPDTDPDAWEALYTPEEADVFDALKVPFIPPEKRTETALRLALGRLV